MKKKQLIKELYEVMDFMATASEELGDKILQKKKLDAYEEVRKFTAIRAKIVSIKNRLKKSLEYESN